MRAGNALHLDVTETLKAGQTNFLAVRVVNPAHGG